MYWTVDGAATKCLTDPHCVAAADYALPANNGSYAIPVHDESKRGKLPSWRVFGVGYVSRDSQAALTDISGEHGRTITLATGRISAATGAYVAKMAKKSGPIMSLGQSGKLCRLNIQSTRRFL